MIRSSLTLGLLALCTIVLALPCRAEAVKPGPVITAEFYSRPYTIDRLYRSMEGPLETRPIQMSRALAPELVWVVGVATEIVGPDGEEPRASEFMCHVNLDFDLDEHWKRLPDRTATTPRIVTLSQGFFELALPEGFGLPVMSDELLRMSTQVLNHNYSDIDTQVRHKVTIRLIRDSDLERPLKALFPAGVSGLKRLGGPDGAFGMAPGAEPPGGASCLPGAHPDHQTARFVLDDPHGRHFIGHWKVAPGEELNRTVVTEFFNLPYDTTLHYAAAHLHPFAEYVELRDLTTDKTLIKLRARNLETLIGLADVETFSSQEGVPLYADHEYELISFYNNTSGEHQDAMATMMMFLLDREGVGGERRQRHPPYLRHQKR